MDKNPEIPGIGFLLIQVPKAEDNIGYPLFPSIDSYKSMYSSKNKKYAVIYIDNVNRYTYNTNVITDYISSNSRG